MRTLVLSVSAGGGHKHAAEAIKNYIQLNEPNSEVMIIDTLKYINPIIDKVVIGSYLKTIKITPSLFGKLYRHTESGDSISSISSKLIDILTYKLLPLIEEFKPDVIISTHPFSTEMISIMKIKHTPSIPMVSIITDFTAHNFWIHPHIDAYIVSNETMVEDMIDKGVNKNTIFNYGIPVYPSFLTKYDRQKTLKELNFDENKTTILVMGGSLGMGKIAELYEKLLSLDVEMQIIVLTGNNQKLYAELNEISITSNKKTAILNFTHNVNKYMQCSNLLLTKPGGITITEGLICEIPMGLFSAIPGQEEKNAEFLINNNLAIDLFDLDKCEGVIKEILKDNIRLENIRINCKKYSRPNSGQNIYKLIKILTQNTNNHRNSMSSIVTPEKSTKQNIKDLFKFIEIYFYKTAEKLFLSN